jgi:hypothetical protein
VDVDLEFSTPDGVAEKARPLPAKTAQSPPPSKAPVSPQKAAPVAHINEARQAKATATASSVPSKSSGVPLRATVPMSQGATALSEDQLSVEGQQILELEERVRKVEFEADVKVAVAEFKTELLSELLSDMKLMQHQVEQLLIRINSKHPDLKQEVLLIKKILADFTSKKRK